MSVAIHIQDAVQKYRDATVIPNLSPGTEMMLPVPLDKSNIFDIDPEKSLMLSVRHQLDEYTGW